MPAGTYQASITISNPLAAPFVETVNVSLTVTAAAASLSVSPTALNFQIQQGSAAQTQTITIGSAGATLNWTAKGDSANPWASISPSSGSAAVATPSSLQVTANPAGLAQGVYSAAIVVSSATTGTSVTVTVNLLVTPAAPTILLSQTGLTFTGIASGGAVPMQTFAVLNSGGGNMNWTATAVGGSWLSASPSSGSSAANSASPPLVQVSTAAGSLAAGAYTGQIRIDAPGATNTPQYVTIAFNVLAASSAVPPIVSPTGLIFVRQAGTSSPGSQTINVTTASPGIISAAVSAGALANPNTGAQLVIVPAAFGVSAASPAQITVQPILAGLPAGQYSTTITIQFLGPTGPSSQTVTLLFVVTAGPISAPAPDGSRRVAARLPGAAAATCSPQNLYVTAQSLGGAFSSAVGYPQNIQAQVIDDCNDLVTGATVIATFSSGDPPLALVGVGNGIYEASWYPGSSASQATVTVTATFGSLTAKTAPIPGQVTGQSRVAPTFTNGASFAANGPLSPGSIISAFWQSPGTSTAQAATLPLATSLAGVQLNIGGRNVPLFYASATQVNAQIPLDVTPNSSAAASFTVTQNSGSAFTSPQTLTIAPASPGIFLTQGQAVITDANGVLISSSNPASPGQVVIIYSTGLGPVNETIALGAPAPANPPATVTTPVQVAIGGQNVTPQFAGLAPNFVGLYQVNVAIPANVSGSAVPVAIVQNGVSSNVAPTVVK
jgi:uncharacterized protein (TIGR03437 family)